MIVPDEELGFELVPARTQVQSEHHGATLTFRMPRLPARTHATVARAEVSQAGRSEARCWNTPSPGPAQLQLFADEILGSENAGNGVFFLGGPCRGGGGGGGR